MSVFSRSKFKKKASKANSSASSSSLQTSPAVSTSSSRSDVSSSTPHNLAKLDTDGALPPCRDVTDGTPPEVLELGSHIRISSSDLKQSYRKDSLPTETFSPAAASAGRGKTETDLLSPSPSDRQSTVVDSRNLLLTDNREIDTTTVEDLRLQNDEMKHLLRSLHSADVEQSGEETSVEQIVRDVLAQREELVQIRSTLRLQVQRMLQLKEGIDKRQCVLCLFHTIAQHEGDAVQRLSTPFECSEDPNRLTDQTRQILLNDGREFSVLTTSRSDSGLPESCEVSDFYASLAKRDNPARIPAAARTGVATVREGDALEGFSLHATGVPTMGGLAPLQQHSCPMCARSNFTSSIALQTHVNAHFCDSPSDGF